MNGPRRWWLAAAVGATAAAAFGGWRVILADRATPVSLRTVTSRYRTATTLHGDVAGTAGSPPAPARGVYVYATSGFERIDALGGTRHDYPATSTLTVRDGACGLTIRWDVLVQRWREDDLCRVADGSALGGYREYHEFFNRPDLQRYTCVASPGGGPATSLPHLLEPGASWSRRCSSGSITQVADMTLIARETVSVGERPIAALHVRTVIDTSGASRGHDTSDDWVDGASGLLLRRVFDGASTNDSAIGDVHLVEHYELRLSSTTPNR